MHKGLLQYVCALIQKQCTVDQEFFIGEIFRQLNFCLALFLLL